jgi:hypothetical protein
MAVTTGAHATTAARLQLDDDILSHYLRATPEPARSLIVRLSKGTSPRTLLLEGQVVPSFLDDVLTDLAARGAVVGVQDEEGNELLEPAVAAALAILQGAPARNSTPLSPIRPSMTPPPVIAKARDDAQESSVSASIEEILAPQPPPAAKIKTGISKAAAVETSLQVSVQELLDEEARVLAEERRNSKPSSLEDAVIQKLSESSPAPGAHTSSPLPPPIIEPSALRPRSSNPPETKGTEERTEVETIYELQLATPTIPHLDPPLTEERIESGPSLPKPSETEADGAEDDESEPEPAAAKPPSKRDEKYTPLSSVARASHPPQSRNNNTVRWLAVLATVALGAYVAVRLSIAQAPPEPVPAPAVSVEAPVNVLYTEPPKDVTLSDNEGWLAVHAPDGADVYVDGIKRPAGPMVAGAHDIRVGARTQTVDVRASKTTRVDWP